jgi:N-acetylmuramoyl-L-alanine amidase
METYHNVWREKPTKPYPPMILIEAVFLTNSDDEAFILLASNQQLFAEFVHYGFDDFVGQ